MGFFNNSYILNTQLFFHPRDWDIALIHESYSYGFKFWFLAITLYVWSKPTQPDIFGGSYNTEPLKSYCCDENIITGLKHCCTKCGKELNETGGHLIKDT